ncbi:MAG: TIGR04282 family arsenosugar biosynthesis glycosyltransferase [Planctomycetales bacterium]|nr:TIGR04282 family arsenosugar biosynthesis glycosyltransferase [Planctomycetales bacterium]
MRQLGVFAKYWEPGAVKTRLAATVGEQVAAEFHRFSLETTLRRCEAVADRNVLGYWPPDKWDAFGCVCRGWWDGLPQPSGNLGTRMWHYFVTSFATGADRVVLIGSDSPNLPISIVAQAFELLSERTLVLGPSTDGGYYLVGGRREMPNIFADISWGTPEVWQQTVTQIHALDLVWSELPRWYDIDTWQDVLRLRADLSQIPGDRHLERLGRFVSQLVGGRSEEGRGEGTS